MRDRNPKTRVRAAYFVALYHREIPAPIEILREGLRSSDPELASMSRDALQALDAREGG